MERINENNQLTVRGKILKEFEFAYEIIKYLKDEDTADTVFKEIYYKN